MGQKASVHALENHATSKKVSTPKKLGINTIFLGVGVFFDLKPKILAWDQSLGPKTSMQINESHQTSKKGPIKILQNVHLRKFLKLEYL